MQKLNRKKLKEIKEKIGKLERKKKKNRIQDYCRSRSLQSDTSITVPHPKAGPLGTQPGE